ncbi:DUF2062 domain-containing protein [Aestuariivirga sp.]|uniref:DUF2062 domain-containing protein n=1 Tax=Aestuariivirga sp. TaxID=2650926 RepID=UPI00391C84E1
MFRSTRKVSLVARVSVVVWPHCGFRRAWNCQLLRLSRLKTSPHKISIGFAAGAFASFLPLIGLHFILAAALAFAVRGNIIASAVGTVVGNPITFPMIWFATYKVGVAFTGQNRHPNTEGSPNPAEFQIGFSTDSIPRLWEALGETFWPMLIGALPLGLICASGCYLLVYSSLSGVRRRAASFSRPSALARRSWT